MSAVIGHVLATAAVDPAEALEHFRRRLGCEVVPWDVYHDRAAGVAGFILLDSRTRDEYAGGHLPGAISAPHGEIDEVFAAGLDRTLVHVCYGWGPACNAATRAAARLAGFGLTVKEMVGGLEYWQRAGYPIEPAGVGSG